MADPTDFNGIVIAAATEYLLANSVVPPTDFNGAVIACARKYLALQGVAAPSDFNGAVLAGLQRYLSVHGAVIPPDINGAASAAAAVYLADQGQIVPPDLQGRIIAALSISSPPAPPAFTLNWNPSVNLTNWRAKRAAVIGGTARCTIVSVGESTSTGVGAGTGGIGIVNGWINAWPNRLSVKLAAGGIASTTSSFFNGAGGGNLTFSTLASYDPRRTFGAGWDNYVPSPPSGWFGGNYLFSQGGTGNINFAPGTSFDTIKVHDFSGGVAGTLTVAIDGGSNLSPTLPQSGGSAYRITSYTVALGVHTVNLRGLNTSETVMGGCQVFNSAVKAVDVIIGGIPSGNVLQSSDTTDPWSAGNATGALQPDLLIIKTAINDALDLTTMAAFKAGLQKLVDKGKLTGDVVMLTSNPWSGSTQQEQEDLRTAMIEVANTNGLLVIDGFNFYGGTWAAADSAGLMFDQYHPNATGYDAEAQLIYDILMAA